MVLLKTVPLDGSEDIYTCIHIKNQKKKNVKYYIQVKK